MSHGSVAHLTASSGRDEYPYAPRPLATPPYGPGPYGSPVPSAPSGPSASPMAYGPGPAIPHVSAPSPGVPPVPYAGPRSGPDFWPPAQAPNHAVPPAAAPAGWQRQAPAAPVYGPAGPAYPQAPAHLPPSPYVQTPAPAYLPPRPAHQDPDRVSPAAAFGVIALSLLLLGAVLAYVVLDPFAPPAARSTSQPSSTQPGSTQPGPATTQPPLPGSGPSTASAAPASTKGSSREDQLLRANPLYAQTLSGSCARQGLPSTTAETKKVVQGYTDCLNALWKPRVVAAGYTFRPPSVQYFTGSVTTACGRSPRTEDTPAFYCPPEETIYIAETGIEMMQIHRMLGLELVAHEYGHHVQRLSLVLDGIDLPDSTLSTTEAGRRVELQAHCLAYAVAGNVKGYGPNAEELKFLKRVWEVPSDPEGHGSPQAIKLWGERGLAATSLKACDTFSAPAAEVT